MEHVIAHTFFLQKILKWMYNNYFSLLTNYGINDKLYFKIS